MTRFEYKEDVDKLFKNKLLGNNHPPYYSCNII